MAEPPLTVNEQELRDRLEAYPKSVPLERTAAALAASCGLSPADTLAALQGLASRTPPLAREIEDATIGFFWISAPPDDTGPEPS